MKNQNQSFLAFFSKVIFAVAYVAMVSPIASANSAPGLPTSVEESTNPQKSNLLAQSEDLPEVIKASVFKDISQRANVEVSSLRVLRAEKTTWSNSCLGLKSDEVCSQALLPGWQVVVAGSNQAWVYRTDESGSIAKIDETSSQSVTATILKTQTINEQISSRSTTVERRSQVLTARTTTVSREDEENMNAVSSSSTRVSAATVDVKSKKPGFSLTILQPSGSFEEVIARVSVKGKRGRGYLKERFLGDYKYKIKQKAKFVKGLKAGDRIVVRLYDTQNRFIGYSEFECLSANTAVNLILSNNASEYKVVRTVYGLDTNFDGAIDSGSTTYDYFTQVNEQRVTFLRSSQQVNVSQFQVEGLSAVASRSVYPASFVQGEYALVQQSVSASSANLAAALKAAPSQLVEVNEVSDDGASTFDVSKMMMDYREVGVANGIQVKFSDVSINHWAKDFIAELAAMEVIEGFPDGSFRPEEQVTRAQFAAMIAQAFEKAKVRKLAKFSDVSSGYWAFNAIREAYQTGFLTSSGNQFKPTQSLSRLEAMLAIARGLNYTVTGSTEAILAAYSDATTIRREVRGTIAALAERGIIVNYPNIETLNANKVATRAEVSALIYKALVSTGEVSDISSEYVAGERKTEIESRVSETEDEGGGKKPKRHCNQGIGNGAEGCDPGNSRPHGGSNDEGGRTPGNKR
ncbi:S-layer protein [Calothrix sp. HK-06]|nr:S-layer protein [Calothrix sp. HK-06]